MPANQLPTRMIAIDAAAPDPGRLDEVARALDRGEVVALPTDTLYGLAANALDPAAVARVFEIKGREAAKPLPVVVRDPAQVARLARALPEWFAALAAAYWPGPLSLIVPARADLPPALTAGSAGVAVRQPDAAILAGILRRVGYPLTATSANRSGAPACRSAAAVKRQLRGRVPLIVDGGAAPRALPSTLVDLTAATPRVLRPGAVPAAELEARWHPHPRSGSPPPRVS